MRKLAFGLLVWLNAAVASAICPRPVPKVCSSYFESDAVFVGTVLSRRYVDEFQSLRFKIGVSRVLRGSVGGFALVYTGNDSGRVLWDVGRQYVVFARRSAGRLQVGNECAPLSDPVRLAETVQEFEAVQLSRDTFVEGEVLKTLRHGAGLAGVDVRIHGSERTYHAKSDRQGRFRVQVAPGRYQVTVDSKLARKTEYNWSNLDNLVLVPGQCAQLQFVAP